MKKKLIVGTLLVALAAIPTWAAVGMRDANSVDPAVCMEQMQTHHQQMMDQAVAKGVITADEAAMLQQDMKDIMPIMQKIRQHYGAQHGAMMGQHSGMMGQHGMQAADSNARIEQMRTHHQQMVQQAITDGVITQQEADLLAAHMEKAFPIMQKLHQNGQTMMQGMHKGQQGCSLHADKEKSL